MEEYQCFDDQRIAEELEQIKGNIDFEALEQKANVFKILGDLNRLKIVELLLQYDQLCVYEISQFIGASVATTSHHLITLRNNNIITSEKMGKRVIYSINVDQVRHLIDMADMISFSCNQVPTQ